MVILVILFVDAFFSFSYITPLSAVFSETCVHYHLYADDMQKMQLFIPFTSSEFLDIIFILESTMTVVCSSLSENLFEFNPFMTNFMLLG